MKPRRSVFPAGRRVQGKTTDKVDQSVGQAVGNTSRHQTFRQPDHCRDRAGRGETGTYIITVRSQALQRLKTDIDIQNDLHEHANMEVKRILAAMAAFNEAARKDGEIFAALNRSCEFQQKLAGQYAEKRAALWQERNAAHVEFSKFIITGAADLADSTVPATVAIRSELEIEGDGDDIELRLRKRATATRAAMESTVNEALDGHLNPHPATKIDA